MNFITETEALIANVKKSTSVTEGAEILVTGINTMLAAAAADVNKMGVAVQSLEPVADLMSALTKKTTPIANAVVQNTTSTDQPVPEDEGTTHSATTSSGAAPAVPVDEEINNGGTADVGPIHNGSTIAQPGTVSNGGSTV